MSTFGLWIVNIIFACLAAIGVGFLVQIKAWPFAATLSLIDVYFWSFSALLMVGKVLEQDSRSSSGSRP